MGLITLLSIDASKCKLIQNKKKEIPSRLIPECAVRKIIYKITIRAYKRFKYFKVQYFLISDMTTITYPILLV